MVPFLPLYRNGDYFLSNKALGYEYAYLLDPGQCRTTHLQEVFLYLSVMLNCLTLCLRYRPEVRPGVPDTLPPAGPADLAVAPGSWAHWGAHRCSHCHTYCCREEEVEA